MAKEKKGTPPPAESSGGINTGVAVIGFILCFLAGAGLMWGYDQKNGVGAGGEAKISAEPGGAKGGAWNDDESPIPVSSKDPMWGKRDALVSIVIFSDYQCPFCSRGEATMDQVRQAYTPEKVRILWKNEPLPMHPNAKPAAEAGQGVYELKGNDAFWKFHDVAFKNQQQLTPDNFEKWAKEAGVTDMAKYKAGLAAHTWAEKVDKDHAQAQAAGVNGTPAFFINGVSIVGAQPFDKFKAVIDQELGKAQAKVASGTPKDKIYVAMTKENKTNQPPPPKKDDDDDGEKEDKNVYKVPVGDSPILGKKDALVTLIVFSDFQCPFCKRVEPTMKSLRDKYGDKLRMVWKNEPLPFHPRAEPAAEVAMEARAEKGDKGFWDAHDKLFESQPKLEDTDLEKVAQDLGLDMGKVKDAMKNHKYKKAIDADQDLADDVQASGTPHFFINGRRLVGAQPLEKFEKIIADELKKAEELKSKGVVDIYDTIIKDGKGAQEPEKKTVAVSPTAPTKGASSAKVVIQQFSDFQCPFCSRVEPTVDEILKAYDGKVKLQWRNLPLPMHPDAPLAAQAALEAYKQKGADAFWKMHKKMFAAQDKLKRETLDEYAKELGLNMDQWKTALDSGTHKAAIDADQKAANDAGISGTPAFVINGYYVSGAQPFPKFRKLIERAIADANK